MAGAARLRPLRALLGMGAGATIAILAITGFYEITPDMTIRRMAAQAAAGDDEGFVSHLDLPALRADARRQLEQALKNRYPPGRVVLEPHRVMEALAGRTIDHAFSREGARDMIDQSRAASSDIAYEIVGLQPNGFVARMTRPRRLDLHFRRQALAWRLVAIHSAPEQEPPQRVVRATPARPGDKVEKS